MALTSSQNKTRKIQKHYLLILKLHTEVKYVSDQGTE